MQQEPSTNPWWKLSFGLQEDMELIKRYRIGMDDLSDKYKLLDKEVTVAEAVESAEII